MFRVTRNIDLPEGTKLEFLKTIGSYHMRILDGLDSLVQVCHHARGSPRHLDPLSASPLLRFPPCPPVVFNTAFELYTLSAPWLILRFNAPPPALRSRRAALTGQGGGSIRMIGPQTGAGRVHVGRVHVGIPGKTDEEKEDLRTVMGTTL